MSTSITRRHFMMTTALAGTSLTAVAVPEPVPVTTDQVVLAPPEKQPEELKIDDAPAHKVGWAIVGLGQLALEEIMPAFHECKLAKPVALVSGHPEKAQKVAKLYDIKEENLYTYKSFDRIIENPEIEVVYIVLPNSMHAEFTIRALRAGKHVLCEKPMATSVRDGEAMKQAAEEAKRKLGVAYRLHYEPLNQQVVKWSKEGKFGKIKLFTASNCQDVKAPNIRLSRDLGGGPVGDVGIYCINAARYVLNEEPVEVMAVSHTPKDDPRFREVPESVAFVLHYPSGAMAVCDCSFGTAETRRYRATCEKGWMEMDPAFGYRGLKLKTADEKEVSDVLIRQVNHFSAEMDAFSRAVLGQEEVKTPADMGIADMRIIEAIGKAYDTKMRISLI